MNINTIPLTVYNRTYFFYYSEPVVIGSSIVKICIDST